VSEYLSGEFPHAERFETRVVLAAEVEIEPVSQLDLEEDPHVVRPLLFGNVDDEPAAQVVENMVGNRPIADRLLPIARRIVRRSLIIESGGVGAGRRRGRNVLAVVTAVLVSPMMSKRRGSVR